MQRITEISAITVNWRPMVGLAVATAATLIRAPLNSRLATDGPPLRRFGARRSNRPNTSSAPQVSALTRIQPPTVPDALIMAQSATTAAREAPTTGVAASAKGALEAARSAAGNMPKMAVQADI